MMSYADTHQLIPSACLAHDDAAARAAFERWQREFDINDIEGGGFMLLPLLESHLAQLGVEHPWRGRMQGVARKARVEHALNFAAVRRTADAAAGRRRRGRSRRVVRRPASAVENRALRRVP